MYLSRLALGHSRMAALWVSNPYRVHQRLEMACGNDPRMLFRIEIGDQRTQILVQTVTEPDWTAAFSDFSVLAAPPECKVFSPLPAEGRTYRFRLLANPTTKKTVKDDEKTRKTRMGILSNADQIQWITRKLLISGAALLDCEVRPQGLIRSRKNPAKDDQNQTHYAVQFEGVLKVTDASLISEAVKRGVGPAKAYGFGLLSLAPMCA
jgi:CRISPR system Cascade subunit CasE